MVTAVVFGFLFFAFWVSYSVCATDIPVRLNTTGDPALYKPSFAAVRISELKTLVNCTLVPEFLDVRDHISAIALENKLIKVNVSIIGSHGPLNDTYPVSVYKPHQWIISTSLTGNALLLLKEYFDAMSLRTLGYGVAYASVTLIQQPSNCLKDAEVENIENSLRLHFLTNFESEENKLPEEAVICNAHVIEEDKIVGRVRYVCCSRTLENTLECSVLKEGMWLQMLFLSIIILEVLIVLYSPHLMPNSVYKAGNVFQNYVFKTEPGKLLKLNVKKITEKEGVDRGFIKTIKHNFAHLRTFKEQLATMVPGKVYTMYVSSVDMAIRGSKIIAEGNAPVSVISFFRNFFVRCNLRYKVSSMAPCCNQDICSHFPCNVVFRWYQCLGFVMMLIMGAVMVFPWLLRIWFYYQHEQEAIMYQDKVLRSRNLTLPYTGNMLSFLSPTHSIYLGIYLLVVIEAVLYAFVPSSVKRRLKFAVGQCIRDMRKTQKLDACGIFVAHMLLPLKKFGGLGCILLPLWLLILPFCLLYLALEVLPIANLSVRLLMNSLYYTIKIITPDAFNIHKRSPEGQGLKNWVKVRLASILVVHYDEKNKRSDQIIQASALILSFVTMWAFLFIVIDCIAFYVECAVYALVGFILNPRDTMKYVSLILLIAVYGNECFSGVHSKYAAYGKAISTEVQAMLGDRVNEEASKSEKEQDNVAFRLPDPDVISERMHLEAGTERYLKWRAPRLVLLLDKSDIPYIPKAFLYEMGTLNHHYCPGVIHLLYLKALLDFSLILVFLMFVFIVIFAFGQAHDISSGGQTIAALGSGFLPLVMRKFLFQTHSSTGIDKSNLKWKNMFSNAVHRFACRWNFTDIHITHVEEAVTTNKAGNSHTDISTNISGIGDTTVDQSTDETRIELMEKSVTVTEDDTCDNIDLVVRSVMNINGTEVMSFYVPGPDAGAELMNVAVEVRSPDAETDI